MERIEIKTENRSRKGDSSLRQPIDYSSRAVRIRLYILVTGFMLVLVLMNEARKPERWSWMGFENLSQRTDDANARPVLDARQEEMESSSDQSSTTTPDGQDGLTEATDPSKPQRSLRSTQSFWRSVFNQMTNRDRRDLVLFLRQLKEGALFEPGKRDELLALLERLDQGVKAQTLEQVDLLQQQADDQARFEAIEGIVKAGAVWSEAIYPFLVGSLTKEMMGLDVEPSTVGLWQSQLENAVMELVEDHTEVLRVQDGPAWLVIWGRILDGASGSYRPVSHYDLTSQPEAYRGAAVEFEGNLRGVERVQMVENGLGVDEYFILWIRSPDVGKTPFCVYTLELPPGAELPSQRFVNVDWDVRIKGYFFKIRTYLNSDSRVAECPLVLSRQATLIPRQVVAVDEPTWPMPWWLLGTVFAMMLVGAAIVARIAYSASQLKTYQPNRDAIQAARHGLQALESNPQIRSPRERVAELEQDERH